MLGPTAEHAMALRPTVERKVAVIDSRFRLTELKTGESATVGQLVGGARFRSRLAALGFTPGAQITMLQNIGYGPLIVRLRDARIALGRGEASKIRIAPAKRPR
jgi:ferrous iron transport protein A